MSKHSYFPPTISKDALELANVRGQASVEWHRANRLTPDNLDEFKRYIKKAEKEYLKQLEK